MRWGSILGGAAEGFKSTMEWQQQQEARENELMKARGLRLAQQGIDPSSDPSVKAWLEGSSPAGSNPLSRAADWVGNKLGLGGNTTGSAGTGTPAPPPGAVPAAAATGATGMPTPAAPQPAAATGLPNTAAPAASPAPAPAAPAQPATPAPGGAMPQPVHPAIANAKPDDINKSVDAMSSAGYSDPRTEKIIGYMMKVDPQMGLTMKAQYLQGQLTQMQIDQNKLSMGFSKAMQAFGAGDTQGALNTMGDVIGATTGEKVQVVQQGNQIQVRSLNPDGSIGHIQNITGSVDPTSGKPISAAENFMTQAAAARSPETFLAYKKGLQEVNIQLKEANAATMQANAALANARTNADRLKAEQPLLDLNVKDAKWAFQQKEAIDSLRTQLDNAKTPEDKARLQQLLAERGGGSSSVVTWMGDDGRPHAGLNVNGSIFQKDPVGGGYVSQTANTADAEAANAYEGRVIAGTRYKVAIGVTKAGLYAFKVVDGKGKPISSEVFTSGADAVNAIQMGSARGLPLVGAEDTGPVTKAAKTIGLANSGLPVPATQ